MNIDSCIATVRPCVKTEQSARKVGCTSWMELMRARMRLSTSHLIAEQIRSSNGHRAAVSMAVTSAEALVWTVVISKLFLGAVALRGEFHGTLDRELDDAG